MDLDNITYRGNASDTVGSSLQTFRNSMFLVVFGHFKYPQRAVVYLSVGPLSAGRRPVL